MVPPAPPGMIPELRSRSPKHCWVQKTKEKNKTMTFLLINNRQLLRRAKIIGLFRGEEEEYEEEEEKEEKRRKKMNKQQQQ